MARLLRSLGRLVALFVLSVIALQIYFAARIALMAVVDPQSTTFQRSEAWRLLVEKQRIEWAQQWVDYARISPQLKRAVIASEDAEFTEHAGVDWDAIERAWERNQRAEERVQRFNAQQIERKGSKAAPREARVVGGSTITQQLAKNLFLGSERSLARKGQEFVITLMLEALLSKQRILEIYLNSVEWGEGVFGAEAAAQHYFRKRADQLTPLEAARLAVMLPRPRYFEKLPRSAYLSGRANIIATRMRRAELP
ncbi:MAG: biosynthetic peptidoglycan transglycosylase [Proteobacteria bacterium]|nr:biosynthetic peptidoglycan transglycosylase [Pseudomonadota bacterium]